MSYKVNSIKKFILAYDVKQTKHTNVNYGCNEYINKIYIFISPQISGVIIYFKAYSPELNKTQDIYIYIIYVLIITR